MFLCFQVESRRNLSRRPRSSHLVESLSSDPSLPFTALKGINGDAGCRYFVWFDPPTPPHAKIVILGLLKRKKEFDAYVKANKDQKNWRRIVMVIVGMILLKAILFGKSSSCYLV